MVGYDYCYKTKSFKDSKKGPQFGNTKAVRSFLCVVGIGIGIFGTIVYSF